MAQKYGMQFEEVSAKTGNSVARALDSFIERIVKKKKRLLPWKDIYMLWLLSLNEDFDDDLLQDAVEMLMSE